MNNKIQNIELLSLTIALILSSFIGYGFHIILKTCQTDSWIALFFCLFLSIPLIYLFYKIFNYEEKLPINKKIEKLYGKKIGFIIQHW